MGVVASTTPTAHPSEGGADWAPAGTVCCKNGNDRNETKLRGELGMLGELSLRHRRLFSVFWGIGSLCLTDADHQKSPTWVVYTKNHGATNRR